MIQFFWLVDFLGLFLGRLILSLFLFLEYLRRRKENKILSFLYLILSSLIFLGYYSSFAFLFLIFLELAIILKNIFLKKQKFQELEYRFLRLALAIVFLFVGPGSLSLDRIFNIRFTQANSYPFLITEIMYNPEGNDLGREWLEVFNQSNLTFTIKTGRSGWRINDGNNHLFKEGEVTLAPQEVLVIVQDRNKFLQEYPNFNGKLIEANFTLKNESGTIKIFKENNELAAEAFYQNAFGGNGNGYSLVFINNQWQESKIKGGSPGKIENYNLQEPIITTTTTTTITTTTIEIETSEATSTNLVAVASGTPFFEIKEKERVIVETTSQSFEKEILLTLVISEFLPNPKGNDQGKEFIEIYNYGDQEIDLSNFVLEIGSKKIKLSGTIKPFSYYFLTNKDYHFSLRNQGETISLYFDKEKIFSINYQGKAPEGKSFSRQGFGKKEWFWGEPTPGKENKMIVAEEEKSDFYREENLPFNLQSEKINLSTKTKNLALISQSEEKSIFLIFFSLFLIILFSLLVFIFL